MSFVYETVTIDSQIYDVYSNQADALAYAQGSINAAAFLALSTDDQGRMLVTATRIFDRQCWLGTRSDPSQSLEWPRTNTGVDGVTDDTIPAGITTGSIEMAIAFASGSTAQDDPIPGAQKIENLKAGSVSITYFRDAGGILDFTRFPLIVQELVGKFTCGSVTIPGAQSFDTCEKTATRHHYGYNEGM